MSEDITETIKKFVGLAQKPILSSGENEQVRQLMCQLKILGMSNTDITELSKGKWSESTIKGYTKGTKSPIENPWHDAVAAFNEMAAAGLTLEDVKATLVLKHDLVATGVTLEHVVELVAEAKPMGLGFLVGQHQKMKDLQLKPGDLAKIISSIKDLEEIELERGALPGIITIFKNYGNVEDLIEAFAKYIDLTEIEKQISQADVDYKNLAQKLTEGEKHFAEIMDKIHQAQQVLDTHKKITALGFGHPELEKLSALCSAYGGVKKVLKAVETYTQYEDIIQRTSKAKLKLDETESEVAKSEAKYSHLNAATTMCLTLIRDYKFGLDAVATIYSLAQKYGKPLEVLKAIEGYGQIQAINQELAELGGRVDEKRKLLAGLAGQYCEILNQIDPLVARALSAGAEIAKLEAEIAKSKNLTIFLDFCNNPDTAGFEESSPLVLSIAISLRKYLKKHEDRIKSTYHLLSHLDTLISELGGN